MFPHYFWVSGRIWCFFRSLTRNIGSIRHWLFISRSKVQTFTPTVFTMLNQQQPTAEKSVQTHNSSTSSTLLVSNHPENAATEVANTLVSMATGRQRAPTGVKQLVRSSWACCWLVSSFDSERYQCAESIVVVVVTVGFNTTRPLACWVHHFSRCSYCDRSGQSGKINCSKRRRSSSDERWERDVHRGVSGCPDDIERLRQNSAQQKQQRRVNIEKLQTGHGRTHPVWSDCRQTKKTCRTDSCQRSPQ